jgi:hypothetical protein
MADPKSPKPKADWWKTNAPITNAVANFPLQLIRNGLNVVGAVGKDVSNAAKNPKTAGRRFTTEGINAIQQANEQERQNVAGFLYDAFTPGMNKTAAGKAAAIAPKSAMPTATGGQAGAWSTNYGTTAEAERARLIAAGAMPTPPAGIPTTRPAAPAAPQGFTADQLYIDPTPAFQPVLDQYAQQQAQLQDRYGQNAADIKNIFGNLTTVRALDKTKIAQQYQTSIQQQQDALAARTAETRMATEAGQQGAATAAGEMGTAGQPAPTDSLTAQAAEQGVADSNAYQTTWAALQNVMSQQAQNDVQNAIQGYDYQQTAGLEQLRNNLEDRLAAIQGDVAGTQSQLAQAKLSGQQTVANAKYGEAQDAKAQAAALAAAQAKAATPKEQSYSKDIYGWGQRVASAGKDATGITNSINQAATAELNAQKARGIAQPKLTKANLQNRWLVMFQGDPSTEFAIDYIKNYSGYGS